MNTAAELYLGLMKKVLTNVIYKDPPRPECVDLWGEEYRDYHDELRQEGEDWPSVAHTMVGLKRLDNVQHCLTTVLADAIPGDFIETGVWRGGVCIFARSLLKVYGVTDRTVWVADSFEGFPKTGRDPRGLKFYNPALSVSLDEVRRNFASYDLLDDQVRFLPGWFKDTLPVAPLREIAVARLDGDLYDSTRDALVSLYPKLSVGGFLIVDDYYSVATCREAVDDYRREFDIAEDIIRIDYTGGFWRRSS